MSPYLQESEGRFRPAASHRAIVAGSILSLHVLVLYLFATGMVHTATKVLDSRIVSTVTQLPKIVHPDDPARVKPTITELGPVVAPQPPTVTEETQEDNGSPLIITPSAKSDPVVTIAPEPIRVMGQNRLPNSEDYYPADMRRQGIAGATTVRACVDEKGTLQGDPLIEQSSGYARLDQGALNVARAGRYARSIQAGMPVPNCFRIRVGFQIK